MRQPSTSSLSPTACRLRPPLPSSARGLQSPLSASPRLPSQRYEGAEGRTGGKATRTGACRQPGALTGPIKGGWAKYGLGQLVGQVQWRSGAWRPQGIPHPTRCDDCAAMSGEPGQQHPCFILEGRSKHAGCSICAATLVLVIKQAVRSSKPLVVSRNVAGKGQGTCHQHSPDGRLPCGCLSLRARRLAHTSTGLSLRQEPWPTARLLSRQGSGAMANGDLLRRGDEWRDQVPHPGSGK